MNISLLSSAAIIAASFTFIPSAPAFASVPAILLEQNGGPGVYVDLVHVDEFKTTDNVVLIDIRTPDRYAAGHIPGAINIPRDRIETQVVSGVLGETKTIEELEPVLAAAGLTYDQRIIVYGEKDEGPLNPTSGRYAGKIYVSLDQAGFGKVHVLNGGVEAWEGELSTEPAVLPPSQQKLTDAKPVIVDKEYVRAALGKEADNVFVLDMGGASRYAESRIKGSYSVPTGLYSDTNSLSEDLSALIAKLDEIGVRKDSEIITTCGWGWAASDGLALLKDLGYTNVKLYDGSWTEWVQDPTTPKAGSKFDTL